MRKKQTLDDIAKKLFICFVCCIVLYLSFPLLLFAVISGPKNILHEKIFCDFDICICRNNAWYDFPLDEAYEISEILEDGFRNRALFYNDISPKYIFDFRNQGSIEILKYYRFAVNDKYIVCYTLSLDKTSISKGKVYHFNNEDYYRLSKYLDDLDLD